MTQTFTDLKEVRRYLQGLNIEYGDAERIDGNMKGALPRNENEQARRTAALFFEYKGGIYGLANDTTFVAASRFYEKLERSSDINNAFFVEEFTEKGTRCLWLGRTKDEPDGWYCYEARYFNNCPDRGLPKAA